MSNDDIALGYDLDPAGYLVGVQQIDAANQRLTGSLNNVVVASSGVQRAMNYITPSRAAIGGMTLLAAQAASVQQQLSGLNATSTVTHVNVDKLAGGIRQMARDMPIGSGGSRQLVEFFSKAGIEAAGSEKKIESLSRTTAKLSGATGEGPQQLAQGLTELAKATGNQNLDPKRYSSLADALTTVSAQSGASASGILNFSKTIAPLANASGIGATGVLGISAAFSKIGEDGLGASTAVNKMLSDLNRSVREGSPELKTYAQFVGQSADEFERLFKQNPAEALTRVTEAIAKAGPAGPRMLEQIGVEGIRGQRSIQALVASGGLRESIATATSAYGSGSTQKAADAAFGGLNDSLTELKETSAQVAEAMGAPLLGPLESMTNMFKNIVGLGANIAQSGAGQTAMTALTYGGLGLLGAKTIAGPLGLLGLGRQAATSGPLRSVAGAISMATGRMGGGGFLDRFGAPATAAYGEGRMGPVNTRIFESTYGFADQYRRLVPPSPGAGVFSRMRTGAGAYGSNLLNSYMRMVGQTYSNAATTDPFMRNPAMGASPGFQQAMRAAQGVNTQGLSQWQVLRQGMNAFHKELTTATGATMGLRQQFSAFGGMVGQGARLTGRLGMDAARGIGAVGRGVMSSGLGQTLALSAGIAGASYLYSRYQDQRQANANIGNGDINETINAYRESIGKATETTKTFNQIGQAANDQLAQRAKTLGYGETLSVTGADISQAQQSQSKITRRYSGMPGEVASQIAASATQGLAPDELQAIKIDLLRQYQPDTVSSILSQLPAGLNTAQQTPGSASVLTPQVIQQALAGTASSGRNGLGNFLMLGKGFEALDNNSWFGRSPFNPGGPAYANPLSDDAMAQLSGIHQGITQQFTAQGSKFQGDYASQERMKSMNVALKAAYDNGQVEQFYELSKMFASDVGADPNKVYSATQFAKQGFDISQQFAVDNPQVQAMLARITKAGGVTTGTGGITPQLQRDTFYNSIAPASKFLAQAFDNTRPSAMQQAAAASLATPADVKLQEQATSAIVSGAQDAGKSMSDLATEAHQAASGLAETSDQYAMLKRVQQRAEQQMVIEQQSMAPGQAQLAQYDYYSKQAAIVPQSETQRAEQQNAQGQVIQLEQQMRERLTARLQMQRQADIQETRSREDFVRTREYAEQDYNTQVMRTLRNFRMQEEQTRRNYQVGVLRSEQDFSTSRMRTLRDFHINAERAEQDYQVARGRQVRDYNIALKRQIEDAAATMFDPYSRIQAKPTWDSRNLAVNLQEQTAAMQKQLSQLDQLRKAGLSTSAIDQLGLGKSENAQQVANLASEMSPEVIAELNKAAAERAKAAASLYTDASNKELARQKEDFNKSLADQEADFKKSMGRQRADLNKSLNDASIDFRKSMSRQAADYAYSLQQSRRQLNVSLSDMAADRTRSMSRAQDAMNVQLKRMKDDIRNADVAIAGSMSQLADQVNRSIHGKAVQWQSILKNDTATWVTDMQRNVIPKVGKVFSAFGVKSTVSGPANSGSSALADRSYGGGYNTGGEIQGFSPHPKADNILIRATGGEFMHNVAAVQHYGLSTMRALNEKRVPKERLMGFADGN